MNGKRVYYIVFKIIAYSRRDELIIILIGSYHAVNHDIWFQNTS